MNKILLIVVGIVIALICVAIFLEIIKMLFGLASFIIGTVILLSLFVITVGGAYLILRKIFQG